MADLTRSACGLLALCLLAACAPTLAQVARGPHPLTGGAEPTAVDSAPPPARIDELRIQPDSDCAWADGQWRWQNNRWQWQPGAWVVVAAGCYYADPLMLWVATPDGKGVLFYTHGEWYTAQGQVCAAPKACQG